MYKMCSSIKTIKSQLYIATLLPSYKSLVTIIRFLNYPPSILPKNEHYPRLIPSVVPKIYQPISYFRN